MLNAANTQLDLKVNQVKAAREKMDLSISL